MDNAIKSLLPLSQEPVLAYPEIVKSGVVSKLIGLMSHENADIMIDIAQLIHELIEEDAGAENEDDEDEGREEAIKSLVDALVRLPKIYNYISLMFGLKLEQSILELLVDNLPRLNESEEADRQGVFDIMGEYLCS